MFIAALIIALTSCLVFAHVNFVNEKKTIELTHRIKVERLLRDIRELCVFTGGTYEFENNKYTCDSKNYWSAGAI